MEEKDRAAIIRQIETLLPARTARELLAILAFVRATQTSKERRQEINV